ncbi:MAG: DUF599 domain-containing protein [Rhodocyclaceae bacterium]|nr:DUF599 domain-containing protein [Rhodocyclaceae bacterium]MBX3667800.1 DUF599 domain-containing protein [Rhodocyclaceae bacterium]
MGYSLLADRGSAATRGLIGVGHSYRELWARRMLERENRVSDSALTGNLQTSVSFFANATVFVIGGLMAVLGGLDQLMTATRDLPFARQVPREVWEIKLLLLLWVFVTAYFKFTWSMRQFNLYCILIGAAPAPGAPPEAAEPYARKLAAVSSLAGEEFNLGIRAYYFGLAALAWFVNPWLFVAANTAVVLVLYLRDFRSRLVRVLSEP